MLGDAVSNNFAETCPLPKWGIILNLLSVKIDVCYKPPSVSMPWHSRAVRLHMGAECGFWGSSHLSFSGLKTDRHLAERNNKIRLTTWCVRNKTKLLSTRRTTYHVNCLNVITSQCLFSGFPAILVTRKNGSAHPAGYTSSPNKITHWHFRQTSDVFLQLSTFFKVKG